MTTPTIQSPAELLRFTNEYVDARELGLALVLGRSVVAEADLEIEVEASLLSSLTDTESIDYIVQVDAADLESSPAIVVTKMSKMLDDIEFDKVSDDDAANSLDGYKIAGITRGQINLVLGMQDADGTIIGPSFEIKAEVATDGPAISIEKSVKEDDRVTDFPASGYDSRLIYRAANLLLGRVSKQTDAT